MSSSFFYFSEVSRVLNFKSLQINGYYWQFKIQRNSSGRRFCVTDNQVFFMQMKKDFLFQRQRDDVKEMLEKQVFNCQIMRKSVHEKHGKVA